MKRKQTMYMDGAEQNLGRNRLADGILLAAGMCAMAILGLTAEASVPDDLWQYTEGTDENGNIFCDFKEVEVTLPEDWAGKCGMSTGTDYVKFYHLASKNAMKEAGWGDGGGLLLSLYCSPDEEFKDTLTNYFIVGTSDAGIYYVTLPTDVQGFTEDEEIWSEWQDMAIDVNWVRDNIVMLDSVEEESMYNGALVDLSTLQNVEEYILADSSQRYLDASDLQGMNADELQMAINEIYARHHRKFVIKEIQEYFNEKSWYRGTVEAADFDPSVMNQYEGQNIALMLKQMKALE